MSHEFDVAAEIAAVVSEWRARAMNIVIPVLALIGLPVLLVAVWQDGFRMGWVLRAASAAGFLMVVAAGWRRSWSLEGRALVFFIGAYGISAIQCGLTGLVGSGRIGLLLLPILALILVGNRAGWLAAGISVLIFGAATIMAAAGLLAKSLFTHVNSTDPAFWLLQGAMWLAALVPLMVLFTRFHAAQTRVMIEERRARREVEAAVIERRRLEAEIIRISEEEQRWIGSELHDGLCQQLTATLLACTAVGNRIERRGAPESAAVREVGAMLEGCIGSAYDAAKGLCPVDLDPESLAPALQRLCRRLQQRSSLQCEMRQKGHAPALSPEVAHHLYRIAQEAANNAVKHARCRRIDIELQGAAESCTLRVIDDGQGREPAAELQPGGMGIQIMNYRANAMGGQLRIERPEGGGTIVSCQVPCGRAARIERPVSQE